MDTLPSILIVDDDREIRTLLAEYLESSGFRALVKKYAQMCQQYDG